MKTKIKKFLVSVCVILVVSSLLAFVVIKVALFVENPVPAYVVPSVNVSKKVLSMKEKVLLEVARAGLDVKTAEAIIDCESKWKPDAHAVNWKNQAGVDRGLWMINSVAHKDVSNACSYDPICSTKEAIKIYKERGNWSAWTCSRLIAKS